jgi:hypothetical protein
MIPGFAPRILPTYAQYDVFIYDVSDSYPCSSMASTRHGKEHGIILSRQLESSRKSWGFSNGIHQWVYILLLVHPTEDMACLIFVDNTPFFPMPLLFCLLAVPLF